MNLLSINDLSKSFGNQIVFDGVNLVINKGEFISIIGKSGTGKSTLLNIIAGLLKSNKGTININRKLSDKIFPYKKPIIVFQEYNNSLFPWKTVFENVEFVIENNLENIKRKELVYKYLEIVDLLAARDKYPWELSGGMQQRVAIARALIVRPEILLLDEPFGSLDAGSRRELEIQLSKIWKMFNITIILVTHDIDEAIFLSDRIFVLGGKPSNFLDEINIDIPFPRNYFETLNSLNFLKHRKYISQYFE